MAQRVQSVGTADEGGVLVDVGLDASSFIDVLRASSLAGTLGCTYLPGLVGTVDIPKKSAGASFGWLAEDAASAATDITLAKLTLTPETISGSIYMTRRSLMQTTPAIDGLVRDDIVKGLGLAIDAAIFEGAGSSNVPKGVANQTGVNTSTVTTPAAPDYDEIVAFETAVEADNALAGSLHYVTTPAMYGYMRTKTVDSGSATFISDKIGYPLHRSTQMDANRILFGNFADVLIGLWGALDINVDVATAAAKGGVWLRAFQDANIVIRHPESFCINA
jgi:HK97 family phage major capsid protein